MPKRIQDLNNALDVLRRSVEHTSSVVQDLRSIQGTGVEIMHLEEAVDEMMVSIGMAEEELFTLEEQANLDLSDLAEENQPR